MHTQTHTHRHTHIHTHTHTHNKRCVSPHPSIAKSVFRFLSLLSVVLVTSLFCSIIINKLNRCTARLIRLCFDFRHFPIQNVKTAKESDGRAHHHSHKPCFAELLFALKLFWRVFTSVLMYNSWSVQPQQASWSHPGDQRTTNIPQDGHLTKYSLRNKFWNVSSKFST